MGCLLVGLTFPAELRALGIGGSYALFALLCAASAWFMHALMVETKGQPLERVRTLLSRGDGAAAS